MPNALIRTATAKSDVDTMRQHPEKTSNGPEITSKETNLLYKDVQTSEQFKVIAITSPLMGYPVIGVVEDQGPNGTRVKSP